MTAWLSALIQQATSPTGFICHSREDGSPEKLGNVPDYGVFGYDEVDEKKSRN